jgi:hypothetical protein
MVKTIERVFRAQRGLNVLYRPNRYTLNPETLLDMKVQLIFIDFADTL